MVVISRRVDASIRSFCDKCSITPRIALNTSKFAAYVSTALMPVEVLALKGVHPFSPNDTQVVGNVYVFVGLTFSTISVVFASFNRVISNRGVIAG